MIYPSIIALISIYILIIPDDVLGYRRGSFELMVGNCNNLSDENVVFKDHVTEGMIPFMVKTSTTTYKGHQTISCIMALSKYDITEGSTVYIKQGGVGKTYVVLEMESKRSHGFDYTINIYSRGANNLYIGKGITPLLLITMYFLLSLYNYK